ncbi:MAG: spore germination protein [Clostridia bacterium]|nr:spore germination protein [Clostridia bacterium]
MMKEGNFGIREAVYLTILVLITKIFYTSIRVVVKTTGTASWYSTLISCVTSIVLFLLLYTLMKRFPGKDLVQIFDKVTGKIIGKILSLVFVLYFIYYAGSSLREFVEMIKAYNLPYTPPSLILAAFITVIVSLAYVGLEGISRFAVVSFYPIMVGILAILLLAVPYYNFNAIFPIGGYGISKTLSVGLLRSSAYTEVVILAFIINSIHGVKIFKKTGLISLGIAGIIISATILCSLMAFDYPQGGENVSDLFQLARIIYFNRFFQRIESIFLFIWIMASLVTVGATFYISLSIFCKAFNVEQHRPLILPFSFLTFMVALEPKSLTEVTQRNIAFVRTYSIFILYLIPIFVLLLAFILGKKGAETKHAKG